MNPTTQSSTTSTHPARQQRILRLPEVKAKTGFGRSTIYAPFYIKRGANGEFPRSIRIGARAVGWREATEGLSRACAAKALMAAGYLVPDGNRPQRKVSLPDNTRPRMYCVKGSILDDKKGDESCLGLSPCSVPPVNLRAGRGLKAKADNTASVLVVYLL